MMFKIEERVKQMSWSEGRCMMYELDMTKDYACEALLSKK
jgi:hypothetical protein